MWFFMTKFFDLAQCFQGSTITYQYFILLYSHIIFRRMAIPHFIYPLVDDIWIVYSFGLLWIVLLCTFMYRFLCGHMFSFSCILRRQLLCHIVTFFFFKNFQIILQSSCSSLHSHPKYKIFIFTNTHYCLSFFYYSCPNEDHVILVSPELSKMPGTQ